jgi:glycerol-3-phosphate dehydrogenase
MTSSAPEAMRNEALRRIAEDRRVNVLIIGAGVNGAAVFRDLALQGVDCLLVDKGDWCAGASAAPSRLIHGGLKYLETGQFRLVAESTRERNLLLKNAPHFVRALPTIIPIRSYFGGIVPSVLRFFKRKAKTSDRGLLIVELGLALYDWFGSRHRAMPRHKLALRGAAKRRLPGMSSSIVALATYYDARVSQAERLCYELVADGQRAHSGAVALNYVAVRGLADGRVVLRDEKSGQTFAIEPQIIVNAAGPWIDQVNRALTIDKSQIGGAKGSHLILDNRALVEQLDGHMVYFGSSDGRICLVYPFFGRALVGSTDIRDDDPDSTVCDEAETRYMLAMLAEIFPDVGATQDQIVYRYSGVRPLPIAEVEDPSEVTRDHSLGHDRLPGTAVPVVSMIGGKWTTFRAFAAEATDVVLATIKRERRRDTQMEPIGGGCDFPVTPSARSAWIERRVARFGIARARAEALLDRYGTALDLLFPDRAGFDETMLASLPDYSRGEIVAIVRREQVVELADLAFRRTPIAISGRLTGAAIAELAVIAARELGWSEAEQNRQIAATAKIARERHGVRLESVNDEVSVA